MGGTKKKRQRRTTGKARPRHEPGTDSPDPATAPCSLRAAFAGHGRHALAVWAGLLLVYAATMPRVVTYEDAAIFNLICYHGQPAHPPGYPLYSMLCHPFAHLPFVSVPVAGNLLSALFGAAACAVLYLIAAYLTGDRDAAPGGVSGGHLGGYLAGFGYGLSKLFWSQSIIQEVYSLHALLFLLTALLALVYARGRNPAHLNGLAVVCGLGLSNHWVLTMLSAAALPALLLPARAAARRHLRGGQRFARTAGLFVAAAALPYLYLLTTNLPSPVTFYGPLSGLNELLHYITREGYADTDHQQVSWHDKALYLQFALTQTAAQYGAPLLPFVAAGFVLQWRRWPRSVCAALIIVYVSTTYLLVYLVDFPFEELWAGVFGVYAVVAYAAPAVWAALALEQAVGWLRRRITPAAARSAGSVLTALLILSVATANFDFNNRAGDRFAFRQARAVLESFDDNAVALLAGDFQLPIMELNLLEGVREDVTLYNVTGLFLSNRYLPPLQTREKQDRAAADFVARTRRPIYYFRDFEHDYGVEDFCVYKKVRKDWPAGRRTLVMLPALLALWDDAELSGDDLHFDAQAKRMFRQCLVSMILDAENMDADLQRTWRRRLTGGGYYDLLSLIRYVSVYHKQPPGAVTLQQLLDTIDRLPAPDAPPKDRAALLYARAYDQITRMAPAQWQDREAMRGTIDILRRSLAVYPAAENPSAESLLKVLDGLAPKDDAALRQLRRRYPFVE